VSPKAAARLAWGGFALALALVVATAALVVMNRAAINSVDDAQPIEILLGITFSLVGAIIASRRPNHPIGWIFLGIGLVNALNGFATQYAVRSVTGSGLPGGQWAAWLEAWVIVIVFPAGLALFLFLLFPDGRLPTRRWRVEAWLAIVASVVLGVSTWLDPSPLTVRDGLPTVPNPTGIDGFPTIDGSALGLSFLFGLILLGAAAVAIVLRLRRSRGEERQQLKLFAYAAAFSVGAVIATVLLYIPFPNEPQGYFDAAVILGFGIAVPVACANAILKHGLYDLDVVISRTVVVGLLAAFITVVYVAVVVGVGSLFRSSANAGAFLSVVATAVVAVAFQPVRAWARRLADRVVYGDRATPYEVLSEFSERVAGAYAVDDILPTMARVMGEGTGARWADVWLCVGTSLRRSASWGREDGRPSDLETAGDDLPEMQGATLAVPVRHQGELLGALSLRKPSAEPLRPSEDKLVRDLAAQAGLVLRNARLNAELVARLEELQASRQRIVTAQDQARRRLERNIHDGAQQQLVAMAVKLRLANQLAAKDPERAQGLLDELAHELTQALEDLRDLARGIYPPLLADQGLVAALEGQARKASFPVEVDSGGVRRYPQEVEAAVYFCCLEAMQNAAKHAGGAAMTITLDCGEDWLSFEVVDRGPGFDPATVPRGSGLTNMADRVEALGGTLEIVSAPGEGTCIKARIPVTPLPEASVEPVALAAPAASRPDAASPVRSS
jgi:signal transduction histidine kinase